MATGHQILALAEKHLGEQYLDDCPSAPLIDSSYAGPWDCAEFATWVVYQVSGISVGHDGETAYTGYWQSQYPTKCQEITKKQAKKTAGAIYLRFPPAPGKMGHIAISDGNGGTVEAMNTSRGVTRGGLFLRSWDVYLLINGITY